MGVAPQDGALHRGRRGRGREGGRRVHRRSVPAAARPRSTTSCSRPATATCTTTRRPRRCRSRARSPRSTCSARASCPGTSICSTSTWACTTWRRRSGGFSCWSIRSATVECARHPQPRFRRRRRALSPHRIVLNRIDDLRITQVRPLLPPAILLEEIPITDRASDVVADDPAGDCQRAHRVGPAPRGRGRPVLDPRHQGGRGVRPAPAAAQGALRARAHRHDAQLLREAAHVGRLEGAHQRPRSRRELSHQQGAAPGPAAARRSERHGAADGVGVPRHPDSAVHRRPHVVGGDWRAHHREPGPPRAGLGPVDAGRVQERHRRQHADGGGRGAVGALAAPVSVGDQAGRVGDLRDQRQRHLPRDPARRLAHRSELRRVARGRGVRTAARRAGCARR